MGTRVTRILVVDDEPQIRRAMTLNLKARGYELVEAATGERALQVAATENPDLILLDSVCRTWWDRRQPRVRGWSPVPIIVLTVRDDERSKVAARRRGRRLRQ
jgi:two-component system KDP operon response regulator KdpE